MSFDGAMSDAVIRVDNLSKKYLLSHQAKGDGIRHVLESVARSPLRWLSNRRRKRLEQTEEFWALRDISLEVAKGQVVGVIGRNGAGKSTFLKILSRITEPTAGKVQIRGRVASLLEVGTGFHPELTGRENVFLNGAILGMSKAEIRRKFDDIVAFAEVEKFLDTPVKRYSSGMYVRLAFAVAAHLESEILIVDEVLAVGDAAFQAKCLGKMGEVASGQGRTVLFVSHNLAMVESLCQRAALLQQGRLTGYGPTREIMVKYLDYLKSSAKPTSLAERKDRQGNAELIITHLELLDRSRGRVDRPVTGQELVIRLTYEARVNRQLRRCRVGVAVVKEHRALFVVATDLVNNEELKLSGSGFIDFVIPELPLTVGVYELETFVEANSIISDWVERAAELRVEDADFYGTGRNCPPGWEGKCVLVKYRFELHPRSKEAAAPVEPSLL